MILGPTSLLGFFYRCQGLNSQYFPCNMGLGVYIPILRIPIKGRTHHQYRELIDPGTDDVSAAGDSRAQVT